MADVHRCVLSGARRGRLARAPRHQARGADSPSRSSQIRSLPDDARPCHRDWLRGSRVAPEGDCRELVRLSGGSARRSRAPNRDREGTRDIGAENPVLTQIFQRLRAAHGVDFTHYKRTTIRRRIERRTDAATDGEPRRVPRIARSRSWRARRAVPGLPDPGHQALRHPDAFDALRDTCRPRSVKDGLRADPRVGARPAPPAKRSSSPSPSSNTRDGLLAAEDRNFLNDVSEKALQKARAGVTHQCPARGVG